MVSVRAIVAAVNVMYPVVRWVAHQCATWFYRHHEILNASAVPETGATLLVASHGNDLLDIILTFLVTKRRVLFVANIAAADSLMVRWIYSQIGVIPISRMRDARAMMARGEDAPALNARAFIRVTEAFKAGECVAIFPEGVVNDLPHLAPMRTGAAKMALDAMASGEVKNLTLVSVGYQYENSQTPRTDCISVFGQPVHVANWQPVHTGKAVSEFTRAIKDQLQSLTRNAATHKDAEKLNAIGAAIGATICTPLRSPLACSHDGQLLLTNARSHHGLFVAASAASPNSEIALESAASELTGRLALFGAKPWSAFDHAIALKAAGDNSVSIEFPSALSLTLLAPIAVVGWIWHAIPIRAVCAQGIRFAPRPVEVAARTIAPGIYLIALWYVTIPLALLVAGISPWLVLLLFLVQPRLGVVALRWRDDFRTKLLISRVQRAPIATRQEILSAANKLRRLWGELQAAVTSA